MLSLVASGGMFFSAQRRSRRVLLFALLASLAVFAYVCHLEASLMLMPIAIDNKVHEMACNARAVRMRSSPLCGNLPRMTTEVQGIARSLFAITSSVGVSAIVLLSLGVWYIWELMTMEKKADKVSRRERRTKNKNGSSIPWDRIKVIDKKSEVAKGGAAAAAAVGDGIQVADKKND